MNYKICVANEAESKEVQGLFFELGYKWFSSGNQVQHLKQSCSSSFGYLVAWSSGCFTNVIQCGCGDEDAKEITIPQLKDIVVLKRNDPKDSTHYRGDGKEYFQTHDKERHYHFQDGEWVLSTWMNYQLLPQLKPITKEPIMKEYLDPENDYKFIVTDKHFFDWIKVPEGAIKATLCNNFLIFWKDEFLSLSEKNGDTDFTFDEREDYGFVEYMDVNDDAVILWQRETLNDKVASAEAARQSGVFVGAPFSDLPAFNFGAVEVAAVVDESNVEQTLSDRESTYGSFKDVAVTTRNLMNCIDVDSMSAVQQEALHMICSKLARIANGDPNHVDSWHDIAGYASLVVKDINGNP